MSRDHVQATASVLAGLKDFQRETVDYVFRRLWTDPDPAQRFLVADEVGLGKTLVARGVIARTLDHMRAQSNGRVDIVYICSNSQIARQNLARLNVTDAELSHADRLTLLPRELPKLRERSVNILSLTPGTSLDIGHQTGRAEERALLMKYLTPWSKGKLAPVAMHKFFSGVPAVKSFDTALERLAPADVERDIAERLGQAIERGFIDGDLIVNTLVDCVEHFKYLRVTSSIPPEVQRTRSRLIGRLRSIVAAEAVQALNPTLVILDEFQRFKALLDDENPTAELAREIFNRDDAKVLMLSATPYKMYTLPDEPEGDDHYADFRATVRFLAGEAVAAEVTRDLGVMRQAIFDPTTVGAGTTARDRVQATLRKSIVRTERLAATREQDGMLRDVSRAAALTATDVRAYRTAQAVADAVGSSDVLEYWRSSPYLLNMLDEYQLKRQFTQRVPAASTDLTDALTSGDGLLDWAAIERYEQLDPDNAKMRLLLEDVVDCGSWKLAWLPPSLPYYGLNGAYASPELATFTKRLVFSAWQVVPKAIATVVSYEGERHAAQRADPDRAFGERPQPLLTFTRSEGRLSGMPVLALLYPSPTLSRVGDPLTLAQEMGELPASLLRMQNLLRGRIEKLLDALPTGSFDGAVDERWYWAAPFLLDAALGEPQTVFAAEMEGWGEADADEEGAASAATAQQAHVAEAFAVTPEELGRRPDDLEQFVTLLAMAGPGNCALRALSRIAPDTSLDEPELRTHAAEIAWGLRSIFNRPTVIDIVRSTGRRDRYWRSVLNHCLDGGLQAVLDEYVHIQLDSEGRQAKPDLDRTWAVASAIRDSMRLQATNSQVDDIRVEGGAIRVEPRRLSSQFAVRFGRDTSDQGSAQDREKAVRTAFNSPFWPFVLASTSVGQEGLDFHQYCHAVVHWNLPGNPVDLEQREGRVHRYKNHAVRKNAALRYGSVALNREVRDPWAAIFDAAISDRAPGDSDIVPFWVLPAEDGAVIERYVPALPLSLEASRYARLRRTVGAYRSVLGQARQADLLAYARAHGEELVSLTINLAPTTELIDGGS